MLICRPQSVVLFRGSPSTYRHVKHCNLWRGMQIISANHLINFSLLCVCWEKVVRMQWHICVISNEVWLLRLVVFSFFTFARTLRYGLLAHLMTVRIWMHPLPATINKIAINLWFNLKCEEREWGKSNGSNTSKSLAMENGWLGNNFMIREFPSTV